MAVDSALVQVAMSLPVLLPKNFHHRNMNRDSVTPEEDMKNIRLLSNLVNISNLVYLYSMIMKNGKIYFTSSNGTEEEIRTGINLAKYFYEYDDAPADLYKAFKTKQRTFVEYTDKWGAFRSVFIPLEASDGSIYVVAADEKISFIQKKSRGILLEGIFESIIYLLILLPFFIAYKLHYRQINLDLERQVKERTNELEISNKKLSKLAITDFLTAIPNRRYFITMAEQLFYMSKRDGKPLSLLMLDIDNFKRVNDNYGHQTGDDVLVMVTEKVKENLRKADLLGRVGGEELGIVLVDTNLDGAIVIAEKLRGAIEVESHQKDSASINVTVSVGCSELREADTDLSILYARADKHLYRAKAKGRNMVCCG